jgi:Type I phosphodiesterase / nucleotide pyrophosphatase
MFGGLDAEIFRSTLSKDDKLEDHQLYQQFWAETPAARREKLMPFFWGVLMREHGSIAGNRALGSTVRLTNRHRFSYPGYAELLQGVARDDVVASNDNRFYPHPTVLQFLRERLRLPRQGVAVFGSWETFNWIAQHEDGAVEVNAGYEAYESSAGDMRALSQAQFDTRPPWDSARYDIFTFRFAMDYLARYRPRVVYIALDETDDWAHARRYDRVLETLHRTDGWLRELWTALEAGSQYRDCTALVITTDHGRGRTPEDWHGHGSKVEGAEDVWQAYVVPGIARRGEWRDGTLRQSQVASTLARWLGVDFNAARPEAAPPVAQVLP